MSSAWNLFLSDVGQRLFQNLLAALALFFAVRGVRNWNLERRDIRRAELAEQALALAYRARDAIAEVRDPSSFGNEGSTRKRADDEAPESSRALDLAFVPIERLSRSAKVFDTMQSLAYNLDAAFGRDTASPLGQFRLARGKIWAASLSKMRRAAQTGERRQLTAQDIERAERDDAAIWSGLDGDEIKPAIDAAVKALEVAFRPYVEARFRARRYGDLRDRVRNRVSAIVAKLREVATQMT